MRDTECERFTKKMKLLQTVKLDWSMVKSSISQRYSHGSITAGQPRYHDWKDSKGNTRVHASIYKASYVSVTLWLKDPDLDSPTTQAVILLKLHRQMRNIIPRLSRYIVED